MNETTKTQSGASAETSIAISVDDMRFIEKIRFEKTRKDKLHDIIVAYRVSIGL